MDEVGKLSVHLHKYQPVHSTWTEGISTPVVRPPHTDKVTW